MLFRSRVMQPKDKAEIDLLTTEFKLLNTEIEPKVVAIEQLASELKTGHKPQSGTTIERQTQRVREAMAAIGRKIATMPAADREKLEKPIWEIFGPIVGQHTMMERNFRQTPAKEVWLNYLNSAGLKLALKNSSPTTTSTAPTSTSPTTAPAALAEVANRTEYMVNYVRVVGYHLDRRFDPESRRILRELVKNNLTVFDYANLLEAQTRYFDTDNTQSAFDSEIALLWMDHKRVNWEPNWLHYRFAPNAAQRQLMVMRLDAPTPEIVSRMITNSIKTEAEGLTGKIVIDSRGLKIDPKIPNPYANYDQGIRNFADLLQKHTKLEIITDDKPEVLPAGTADDVAMYVGWYSVDQYVPACKFHPGGIGFHLASFTLGSLHQHTNPGWVRALMLDGADVSLGPVAEPYLQAFPAADEMFPLILTGKMSLAECYWRTTPMTSWMISMIGDPLYTPYKKNPPLAVADLPPYLQELLANPQKHTQPGIPAVIGK